MNPAIRFFGILFSLSFPLLTFGQNAPSQKEYSILFYNTENFFDSENDSTITDVSYQLEAEKNWTPWRFRAKTEQLAKVIVAAGEWSSPLIIGLCEIENRNVLEALVKTEPLRKSKYKIIQKDSPDRRGIDVALLYRADYFRPLSYEAIAVKDNSDPTFRTRDILRVTGILNNCDTINTFVNHWPSRYGGIMETAKYRMLAAKTLRLAIDSILAKNHSAKIICMGDFNDTPTDQSLTEVLGAENVGQTHLDDGLINLSSLWIKDKIQTIKSHYRWEVFDQFIVTASFLKDRNCFQYKNAEILKSSFLLQKDEQYGGEKPRRTYSGFKYLGGFSDHLPIVLRFNGN